MVRFFGGGAVLLDWPFPLVHHGLGVFSLEKEDERT
jgi:hypothetical protein